MNDQFTVRAVVIFLGVFALASLGGTSWLIHDHVAAESVAVISGAMGVALGGLGTLLASVKVGDGSPVVPSPEPGLNFRTGQTAGPLPAGDAAP